MREKIIKRHFFFGKPAIVFFSGVMFFAAAVFPAMAAEETVGDYTAAVGTKLGRGILNVVTSPADIPCTMAQDMRESGSSMGLLTGFGKGTLFMLRRILVGASEIGTFIIPAERTIPAVCRETTI